ncbi:MAG: hypothetical protein KC897_06970 [Candidatus Omnitrophica bacterium]|nr:hypothetical protein [Candidatus Omnitrophota bacterium]MCB9721503.1 hypothetical protein [Candidatus Omnitrophota bacterium]
MQIFYLYCRTNPNPIRQYLALSGRVHAGPVLPVTYRSLLEKKVFPDGLYIFTDIELLDGEQRRRLVELYERLADQPPRYRLFNSPGRTLTRFPLLRTLHEQGLNDFNVFRAADDLSSLSFPVFLRRTDDHRGPQTGLLTDRQALNKELERLAHSGEDLRKWLVTEFCNVIDRHGIYRKYSSFVFGTTIIPRHLFFSKDWIQKFDMNLPELDQGREELDFHQHNHFTDQLAAIFDIAGVQFGRIDFGVLNGRVQTWEINTNPMIIAHSHVGNVPRRNIHELFFENFRRAVDRAIQEPPHHRPGPAYWPDRMAMTAGTLCERQRHTPVGELCSRIKWKWDRLARKGGPCVDGRTE